MWRMLVHVSPQPYFWSRARKASLSTNSLQVAEPPGSSSTTNDWTVVDKLVAGAASAPPIEGWRALVSSLLIRIRRI